MRVIGVEGRGGSGKTTLIERLVRTLSRYGGVAVLKHSHDRDLDIDTQGKDTWRYSRAGATVVIGAARERFLMTGSLPLSLPEALDLVRRARPRPRWVFIEGFREALARAPRIPYIAVARTAQEVHRLRREIGRDPLAVLARGRIELPQSRTVLCRSSAEVVEVVRRGLVRRAGSRSR